MQQEYLGAIDVGTTSVRFLLFDKSAHMVAFEQLELGKVTPQAG
jgi:glycerol kinase